MFKITEIVTMKTLNGISKEHVTRIVDDLEKNFHSKQPGFIDSELLYNDKTDEWIMIQHWNSIDNLKEASRKIFLDAASAEFIAALDKQNVKMLILPQVGIW